jgi:hypothetical protein
VAKRLRSRPARNVKGIDAKTIWPSSISTSATPPELPATVCAPIEAATRIISTTPDHSSGESVRRRASPAARQRAVRT